MLTCESAGGAERAVVGVVGAVGAAAAGAEDRAAPQPGATAAGALAGDLDSWGGGPAGWAWGGKGQLAAMPRGVDY